MEAIENPLTAAGVDCSSLKIFSEQCGRPVYQLRLPGGDPALAAVRKIMALTASTGYSPVIVGSPEDLRLRDADPLPAANQIEQTLALASRVGLPEWFSQRHMERLDDFRQFNEGEDPSRFFAREGEWPANIRPSTSLSSAFEIVKRTPLTEILCLLIPSTQPWQAPAYLGFGGWNECPEDSIQCAVFKYWHDRWGADIVAITQDVIEAVVSRPPSTRQDAMALAREQYEFCSDIVEQGTETLAKLAAGLLNGPLWFFWWD
jgi:hypothetical protein